MMRGRRRRAAGILRLLGHGVGGRPGERLAARLGFAANRGTILRHLIRHQRLPDYSAPRVIGIDQWASRRGLRFGTIAVDLERRTVIDPAITAFRETDIWRDAGKVDHSHGGAIARRGAAIFFGSASLSGRMYRGP